MPRVLRLASQEAYPFLADGITGHRPGPRSDAISQAMTDAMQADPPFSIVPEADGDRLSTHPPTQKPTPG